MNARQDGELVDAHGGAWPHDEKAAGKRTSSAFERGADGKYAAGVALLNRPGTRGVSKTTIAMERLHAEEASKVASSSIVVMALPYNPYSKAAIGMAARFNEPKRHLPTGALTRPQRFVAYYRVSTSRQEASGLGLEAQRVLVREYLATNNGDLIGEFAETASGRASKRPRLKEAIHLCRVMRAVLVIARLDRLARSVDLISTLVESGLDFVAVDFPHANRFTVHVLAAIAEYESKLNSERTKLAIAAAHAKGATRKIPPSKRGQPMPPGCLAASNLATQAKADARARDLAPIIWPMVEEGCSYREVAENLNRRGIKTPRGRPRGWTANGVSRLARRTNKEFSVAFEAKALARNRVGVLRANRLLAEVSPILLDMRRDGCSYGEMAKELERREIKPSRGGSWGQTTIWRYLKRAHCVRYLRTRESRPK